MFSVEVLSRLNDEAAERAADEQKMPYMPFDAAEIDAYPPIPFPNFGSDYIPAGWAKLDEVWFVDKTGHGKESEPALTVEHFLCVLKDYVSEHPTHGYAITEEGQFQLYVSPFVRFESYSVDET